MSNLPFVSKLLEKIGLSQLLVYLERNYLWHVFLVGVSIAAQRRALFRVFNDLLTSSDSDHISVLTVLDLSAAFHTIDHDSLLNRFRDVFGIRDCSCVLWVISEWKEPDCFCSGPGIGTILLVVWCSSGLGTQPDPLHPVHTASI